MSGQHSQHLPGFTAESSLYRSGMTCRGFVGRSLEGTIVPAGSGCGLCAPSWTHFCFDEHCFDDTQCHCRSMLLATVPPDIDQPNPMGPISTPISGLSNAPMPSQYMGFPQ